MCNRRFVVITGAYALSMTGTLGFISPAIYHGFRSPCVLSSASSRRVGSTVPRSKFQRRCVRMIGGNTHPRKKVVFLGTPDVAALSLDLLLEASRQDQADGFDVVRVVSNPPARTGRKKVLQPSPVQALAETEGVPIMTPVTARDEIFLTELEDLQPDLCITAAYGQFLPQRFLDIPKYGTLNVHPSLLPRYRGASPVQRCLEAGDAETGVTVAFTVLKMDAGPIVRQTVRQLDGSEKTPLLLQELFREGTKQLIDCLSSVWDGSAKRVPQDEAAAVKAAKINILEARCCFNTSGAAQIHNKVRAFAGWPGTWALFSWGEGPDADARKVKLITTAVGEPRTAETRDGRLGRRRVFLRDGALELICTDGSVLRVLELQPLNKNVMGAKAFINGLRGEEVTWVELEPLEVVAA